MSTASPEPPSVANATAPRAAAGPQFPCLDGLRTVAVLSAMLQHVGFVSGLGAGSSFGGHLVRHLEIGPAIFFMLSGFLLYRAFASRAYRGEAPAALPTFFWHRALRVLPAYWLALTILLVPFLFGIDANGPLDVVRFYSLTHVYAGEAFYRGVQQSYTLAVEIGFYLCLPLYAALTRRLGANKAPNDRLRVELIAAALLYLAAIAWRALVYSRTLFPEIDYGDGRFAIPAEHWLPGYFDVFALGMAVATVHAWTQATQQPARRLEALAQRPLVCLGGAVSCYLLVTFGLDIPFGPVTTTGLDGYARSALQGLCAFLLLVPAVFGDQTRGALRRFLRWRPIAYIGLVSYGVYLWHNGFLVHGVDWTNSQLFFGPFWVLFAITFGGSLICAALSYHLMERPLMRFKNAGLGRPRGEGRTAVS